MKYLFICNGNVARSQEAEAFFNRLKLNSDDSAESAGIEVNIEKPIDPFVLKVMAELGYDLSNAKRKFLNEKMSADADVIVSFKPRNELPDYVQSRKDIIFWQVPDPRHQTIDFHKNVRDQIHALVINLLGQ